MSALGQKRTCALQLGMSALCQKRTFLYLFDHLVSAGKYCRRNGEAHCFRGLEVDHEFVLGRRLHRQVGRLLALEDAVNLRRRLPKIVGHIRPVRQQATVSREYMQRINRRQSMPSSRLYDQLTMSDYFRKSERN